MAAALLVAGLIGCDDELDDLQPDLLVTELSAPAEMEAGTSAPVGVTVWNRGMRKAGVPFKVVVEAALPQDPGFNSPVPVDELELPELGARRELTYYRGLTMPDGAEGVWYLRATADSQNTVIEADELNNSAVTSLWNEDPIPPGFGVILCSPDPARDGVTIAIVFASTEALQSDPTVMVGSFPASLSSVTGFDYVYEYPVAGPGIDPEGAVPVTIEGTDTADNVGTGAAMVTLDFTNPTLGPVTASPDPAKAGDTLAITFDSSELLSTTSDVTVAGRSAVFVSETGLTYTYRYDVQGPPTETEGPVTIDVSAADLAGNPGASAGSMVLDFTLPAISSLEVTPDLAKAGDTLAITFDSSELLSASTDVTVAGESATFASESGLTYTYTYLALGSETDGPVTVDVTASDPAGNLGLASVGMTFDFTAPVIDLAVTPDIATPGDTLTITFDSSEPLAATPDVTVDSTPATFVTESALSYTYSYFVVGDETEGAVAVGVSAVDPVGNEGTGTKIVVFDFRKPSLSAAPNPTMLYALSGAADPVTSDVTLALSLGSNIQWEATLADSWLNLNVTSDTLSDGFSKNLVLSADPTGLPEGLYVSTVTFAPSSATSDCEPFDLTVSFAVRPSVPATVGLMYYTSIIDLSQQPYGLLLPDGFAGPGSYPVAVRMHGYGGHANTSFSPAAVVFAMDNDAILVNVEGRGNHQFDGAGETDLFEVLADVDAAYGVDWSRVFLEGGSMGASGAFTHIARHPDVFAGAAGCDGWTDYRQWHRHYYGPGITNPYGVRSARWSNLEDASPLTYAENILPGRLWIAADGQDGDVWCENGAKLHERLDRLPTGHDYLFDPEGGHGTSYDTWGIYGFFDTIATGSPLELDPPSVRIRANRLRTAKHAWLQVERFIWDGFAEVTATRSAGAFDITARNVQRFTILRAPGASLVTVNGVGCGSYSSFPVTIELAIDSAGVVTGGAEHSSTGALEKTPALEGPVMRALCDRFIVAYGSSGGATQTSYNLADAQDFCDAWTDPRRGGQYGFIPAKVLKGSLTFSVGSRDVVGTGTDFTRELKTGDVVSPVFLPPPPSRVWYEVESIVDGTNLTLTQSYSGTIPTDKAEFVPAIIPVDEDDLTRADIAGANLVIFGTEESSRYIGRMCGDVSLPFNLPVQILNDRIVLGDQTYPIPTYGLWMTYPNPFAPDRLVVVGRNVYDADADPRKVLETPESWPWAWPDYVVFNASGQFAAAGHFDRDWLLPDADAPRTAVSFVAPAEGTVYVQGTPSITVTVDVKDESAAAVTGLDQSAFALRVDGEALSASPFGMISAGRYQCSLDIIDLVQITSEDYDPDETTYDLTVEVVRPGATPPVVGIGRTRIMIAQP